MLVCMSEDQYEHGGRGLSGCGIALGISSYFLAPIIQVAVGAGVFYLFSNEDSALCVSALNVTQSRSPLMYAYPSILFYMVCCWCIAPPSSSDYDESSQEDDCRDYLAFSLVAAWPVTSALLAAVVFGGEDSGAVLSCQFAGLATIICSIMLLFAGRLISDPLMKMKRSCSFAQARLSVYKGVLKNWQQLKLYCCPLREAVNNDTVSVTMHPQQNPSIELEIFTQQPVSVIKDLVQVPCGHQFSLEKFKLWRSSLVSQGQTCSCPVCRADIDPDQLITSVPSLQPVPPL